MQLSAPLLFLCLCIITIAVGSYSDGNLASLKGMPHIAKRQTDDFCNNILSREICTNGYYEDYAYVSARCFQRSTAQNIQDVCSVNAAGTICAAIDIPDSQSISNLCTTSTSTATCTLECRAALSNIRAQLGCCVNAYNTTNGDINDQFIYSYALWSACNIEQITERCTPSFELPTGIDPTCTQSNFQERVYSRVLCRAEFAKSLSAALVDGGCGDIASGTSSCAVDNQGDYCLLRNDLYDQLDVASANCRNVDTCNEMCTNTLNNIVSVSGCCFISQFNDTAEGQRDFLSYEFWQRCGLTSPGFCELKFDTSDSRISSGVASKTPERTIAIAAVLFVMTLVSLFV